MTSRRRLAPLALAGAGIATAVLAATSRQIRRDGRSGPLEPADVVLVFGAAVWQSGPSLSLRVRVARAAEVYAGGWAPDIICSGGRSGGESEALVMRALLLECGIPPEAVIPDDGGTTTREAIRSTRRFGGGRWKRVIAVSSPYHMHRILEEARRQGLEVIPCPAPRAGARTARLLAFDLRQHVREVVAVLSYGAIARLASTREFPSVRSASAALASLRARARSFAGEADAVAQASDEVTQRIKSATPTFSDGTAVVRPAAAVLSWPVEGSLTSGFGVRYGRLHTGADVQAPYGTPIRAMAGGVVVYSGWLGPFGNVTVIDHQGGLTTVYAHQAGRLVLEREEVATGHTIGFVGATGRSFGAHLHFEVRVHGAPVDPLTYLQPPDGGASRR